jgi:osmoprotectant transport system substrate-binding protein
MNPWPGRMPAKHSRVRRGYAALTMLLAFLLPLAWAGCGTRQHAELVIGSKNFTEQIVLAELLAQQIEAHTGLHVERKVNLGGTLICHQALLAGKIDLYPEYTGTAFTAILKQSPKQDQSAAETYAAVRDQYRSQFEVAVLPPIGFNNTFAMVVRGDDAARFHLRNISDLQPLAAKWRAGFGYEFMERPDGYSGLSRAYELHFGETPRILDLGLLYRALKDRQVDIVAGNSTDGQIAALGMIALGDDRHYFPPYEAVPLVREATLQKYPQVRAALAPLAGAINDQEMRRMNYAVDGELNDPADVVRAFRTARGL